MYRTGATPGHAPDPPYACAGMYRPGTDPQHVQMSDVLCDYCETPWREDLPLVEGHRGAVICGECLAAAYAAVVLRTPGAATSSGGGEPGQRCECRLCLERRPPPVWVSPRTGVPACRRCIEQAAGVLERDRDYAWRRPSA